MDAKFGQIMKAISDMRESDKSGSHVPPTAPPSGSDKDAADFGGLRQQQLHQLPNPLELMGQLSFAQSGRPIRPAVEGMVPHCSGPHMSNGGSGTNTLLLGLFLGNQLARGGGW